MKCPKCNEEVKPHWKICPNCDYRPKRCSREGCHTGWLPEYAHFCPGCGSPVKGEESLNLKPAIEEFIRKRSNATSDFTSNDEAKQLTITFEGVEFDMIRVEAGSFTMGDDKEGDCPSHGVILTKDYLIGKTPVTQELWETLMGENPSEFKGGDHPVENISWEVCQRFIRKLNEMTGMRFRLPTEAEWEFAARGGNLSGDYEYAGSESVDDVAWYRDNSDGGTHPVLEKAPNELGIYDMSGNVWELCADWYDSDYYNISPQRNPSGPAKGSIHVARGGSWRNVAKFCRISCRFNYSHNFGNSRLGFRLALSE